jgi:hypothetical protein
VVDALQIAESSSVPRIPHSALKPFWNDELDDLKSKSIFWHNIWKANGSPHVGNVYLIKNRSNMQYKYAIKQAYINFENKHDDAIFNHFLNKEIAEFWKSWKSKFRKK